MEKEVTAAADGDASENHTLISSAKALGEATAILPVVTTLSFGFAAAELLSQDESTHPAIMILLMISAGCSLWATAFSVLEYYYVALLSYADTKSTYGKMVNELDGVTISREGLARRVDTQLVRFQSMRRLARNLLWASISFIMIAIGTKTALIHGTSAVVTWVAIVICATSVVGMIVTVHIFRSAYRPIVYAYRCHVRLVPKTVTKDTRTAGMAGSIQKAQVAPFEDP